MSFHLSPKDWRAAEAALKGKPSGTKYDKYPLLNTGEKNKKHQRSPNSFVIVENVIYAIANRNENKHEEGGSSVVKKAITKQGKLVAIRIKSSVLEDMQSDAVKASVLDKLFISQGLRNGQGMKIRLNLINKTIKTNHKLYTVMEWRGDSLFSKMNGLYAKTTNTQKKLIGLRACLLVEKLHEKGIVHGDLKSENLTAKINGNNIALKPIDFDYAKILKPGEVFCSAKKAAGTLVFMSPEIHKEMRYSFLSDTFALASMLLFAIDVTCKDINDKYFNDFYAFTKEELNKNKYTNAIDWLRKKSSWQVDKKLETIFEKMLTHKVEDRIDAKQMILYLCEQLLADKQLEAHFKKEIHAIQLKYRLLESQGVLTKLTTSTTSTTKTSRHIQVQSKSLALTPNLKRTMSDAAPTTKCNPSKTNKNGKKINKTKR